MRAALTLFTPPPVLPPLHEVEIEQTKRANSELRASIARESRAAVAMVVVFLDEVPSPFPVRTSPSYVG